MIPRYSRPDMVALLWSPENKYRIWFEIEAHAADAMAELGVIPKAAAKTIWEKGKATFDAERIDEIEREMKHDVIAFLTHVAEIVGPEARFLHQGMTSSRRPRHLLHRPAVPRRRPAARGRRPGAGGAQAARLEHKLTADGRPQPRHPRRADHLRPQARRPLRRVRRATERLAMARVEIATCAISGAVGTFANVDPRVEEHVAEKLGLAVEPVSTQVIPRDRHADLFRGAGRRRRRRSSAWRPRSATCSAPRCCEAEESSRPGQKGSSAMPHKRNPILTENLTGLARLVRSAVVRRWRTSPCGTSATSATPRSSAASRRTPPSPRLRPAPPGRRDGEAGGLSRATCRRTSTASAAWSIPSGCCWR